MSISYQDLCMTSTTDIDSDQELVSVKKVNKKQILPLVVFKNKIGKNRREKNVKMPSDEIQPQAKNKKD